MRLTVLLIWDGPTDWLNSLSVFTAILPGGPGLAGNRMSPFWILLELRVVEVVVITGAIRRAKLQSDSCHQTKTSFFTGRIPFLSLDQPCQSTEGKNRLARLPLHINCTILVEYRPNHFCFSSQVAHQ